MVAACCVLPAGVLVQSGMGSAANPTGATGGMGHMESGE